MHDANCWAFYVDPTDGTTIIKYCRNFDRSKYYLNWIDTSSTINTQQLIPCLKQYYYNSGTGVCELISTLGATKYAGCDKVTGNGTYTCTECRSGYYLDPAWPNDPWPYCIIESNGTTITNTTTNCLIERRRLDAAKECLICEAGYGLTAAKTCTI